MFDLDKKNVLIIIVKAAIFSITRVCFLQSNTSKIILILIEKIKLLIDLLID